MTNIPTNPLIPTRRNTFGLPRQSPKNSCSRRIFVGNTSCSHCGRVGSSETCSCVSICSRIGVGFRFVQMVNQPKYKYNSENANDYYGNEFCFHVMDVFTKINESYIFKKLSYQRINKS